MSRGKSRKLIARGTLAYAQTLSAMGVPVSRIHADLQLIDLISVPAFTKLLRFFDELQDSDDPSHSKQIESSLFPPWLEDKPAVQEEPADWTYSGFFPYGDWVRSKQSS